MDKILPDFMGTLTKGYNTSHVLRRLIGNWKKALEKFSHRSCSYGSSFKGVWLYSSRCYGFDKAALVYSYLKERKQHADNNSICKTLQTILVPQGSSSVLFESKSAVLWFRQNEIIVNRDKFRAILLKNESKSKVNLNICDENANTTDTVKSRGIDIDEHLVFDTHERYFQIKIL